MDLCTVHQRLLSGYPVARGSEVRLPDGTSIPGVVSVRMEAEAGTGLWQTTITLHALMGAPLSEGVPVIDPSPERVPAHEGGGVEA
jgi:hypothetical protein